MTDSIPIDNLIGSVPCSQAEWEQTPSAVQAHLVSLHTNLPALDNQLSQLGQQVDQLQSRMAQTSATSSKLLEPAEAQMVLPPSCSCGHTSVSDPTPDPTHRVLELSPTDMEVTPVLSHSAIYAGCGLRLQTQVPHLMPPVMARA